MIFKINGGECLIDEQDYKLVSQYTWRVNQFGYAEASIGNKNIRMHRFIMNAQKGHMIDHANCDRLDNRRMNLRFVTHRENAMNKSLNSNNTSGYKGVSWNNHAKSWSVHIQLDGKKKTLGYRKDKHDAAKLYNDAAMAEFGQYASLNKITY